MLRPRQRVLGDFAVAVGLGILVALVSIVQVVVSIGLVVVAVIVAAIALARSDVRPLTLASGVLVGAGAIFLFGAVNTAIACVADRCGNGTPWPLLLFAILTIGLGIVGGLTVVRQPRA